MQPDREPSSGEETPDLHDPSLYFNRRVSWMRFNSRVLELTGDDRHPLLERLRFLCISATNLDEFVEVRIPQLEERRRSGDDAVGPDGSSPAEVLDELDGMIAQFVDRQYEAYGALRAELVDEGIHLLEPTQWNERQREWAGRYFEYEVSPVLSHTPVHPDHPFPRVLNEAMNLLVEVHRGASGRDRDEEVVVRVPESLPSVVRFPPGDGDGIWEFALVSDIVARHVDRLFPAGELRGRVPFRVTRDADIGVTRSGTDDFRMAIEDELFSRRFGAPVRLEVPASAPPDDVERLRQEFGLEPRRCFRLDGPLDLGRLEGIREEVDRPDLEYESFVPGLPPGAREDDLYDEIRDDGIAVHRPYESFEPFVEFIESAAADPDVVAIKQTVYRTSESSPVTEALIRAARAGKRVTVVVELRATFDEERNVQLADRLRDAGATVVYGPEDYKVHAKMALVVRREGSTDYRYAHLATGNYHPGTARHYEDLGYFTADREVTADVAAMFEALERDEPPEGLGRMLAAPSSLRRGLVERIDREIEHAEQGRRTSITAKLNRLTDPDLIRALYRASRSGVEVDLIVRGTCRLRPGVEGVSENIRVRSIVGRFLEHSRAFYFENGGRVEVWISSADWREKNMDRRVEHAAPLLDEDLSKHVAPEVFEVYLADNTHAWSLTPSGEYVRQTPGDEEPRWAQRELLERLRHPDY